MPTRCNRGFYCRSYCLLNMFRAQLCPSSGAQEYYTVVAACGISCCGFQVAGLVWSWGLCVPFAGCWFTSILHVSIAYRISSSGSTYCSLLKSRFKIMTISLLWAMWQHMPYISIHSSIYFIYLSNLSIQLFIHLSSMYPIIYPSIISIFTDFMRHCSYISYLIHVINSGKFLHT